MKNYCSIEGCDKSPITRGYCGAHYQKLRKYGDPRKIVRAKPPELCTMPGCNRPYLAGGYCNVHYQKFCVTPEYKIWIGMKHRCSRKYCRPQHYIERGIKVCEEWIHDFEVFYQHIGPRPSKSHSIDRIDNDGNYEPGNVRWATSIEQMHNQQKDRVK